MAAHKPIVGGMSGTTLIYMNIYPAALKNCGKECENAPSLEVLRAIMISALIPNKKHHTYDELMISTHNMVNPVQNEKLVYKYRNNYQDMFDTKNDKLKEVAILSLKQAVENLKDKNDCHLVINALGGYVKDKDDYNNMRNMLIQYLAA
jgi:hypothetical protein